LTKTVDLPPSDRFEAPQGAGEGERAVPEAVSDLILDKMILKEAARETSKPLSPSAIFLS
jgi:hypothetical protein